MVIRSSENDLISRLNYFGYIPASQIAKKLYVSEKTIYRWVKDINRNMYLKYGESLILTERGKGMKLNEFFMGKQIVLNKNRHDNHLNNIILKLLFRLPKKIKIESLFDDFYASESTIYREVEKIESTLCSYNLILEKDSNYIWVNGNEQNIRNAIKEITSKLNKNKMIDELDIDIHPMDRDFIDSQIKFIEDKIELEITYPYIVNIYIHIFMIIKRYRDGNVQFLEELNSLDDDEKVFINSNYFLYDISKSVIYSISTYLNTSLDSMESVFIFRYLYSFQSNHVEYSESYKKLGYRITDAYIQEYYGTNEGYLEYTALKEDLFNHVLSMLYRIRLGISIENVMLDDIKFVYKDSFKNVSDITKGINSAFIPNYFENKIQENDIGYIVLYFEKYNLIRAQKLNVLVVCSTGVGTSELIKVKLQENFTDINVVDTVSSRTLKKKIAIKEQNIDAILSTININESEVDVPILNISPLLTKNDLFIINQLLKEKIYAE